MTTTLTLKKMLIAPLMAAAVIGSAAALMPGVAEASEHCKRVYIEAINKTGKTVKVVDIDYYDYGSKKWRSEPTTNRILRNGESWSWRKRLERVNGEKTVVRIEYRTKTGKKIIRWSKKKRANSTKQVCNHGDAFKITLK